MLSCLSNCLTKSDQEYPATVYTVYNRSNLTGDIYKIRGAYEVKDEAQAYCDANQSVEYTWYWVSQTFIPPEVPGEHCGWPTYSYPMFYRDNSNKLYTFATCFATADDAENYMLTNSNQNIHYTYSDAKYYPEGQIVLSNSQSSLFKAVVAPAAIVYVPEYK